MHGMMSHGAEQTVVHLPPLQQWGTLADKLAYTYISVYKQIK